MADFPPKKNVAFTFYIPGLVSQANTKIFQSSPTIAAGDFTVFNGTTFGNLATLPDVYPAAGTQVRIQLSASEMNQDVVIVKWIDAAGAEWCDGGCEILTAAKQMTDLSTLTQANILNDATPFAGASIDTIATDVAGLDGQAMRGTDSAALASAWTSTRGGYIDNLSGGAAALQSSVDDLEGRLTATRAGYLDNLSAGAVALEATLGNATYGLSALKTLIDSIDTNTEAAARFTELKGAGWTDETLKSLGDLIDTLLTYGASWVTIALPQIEVNVTSGGVALHRPIVLYVGDDDPDLNFAAVTPAGAAVAITGWTITFTMQPVTGSGGFTDRACSIVSGAGGTFTYAWQAADLATAGEYTGQFKFVKSGGAIQHSAEFDLVIVETI